MIAFTARDYAATLCSTTPSRSTCASRRSHDISRALRLGRMDNCSRGSLRPSIAKTTVATIIPALQYQDAQAAIDFLCTAFGFERKTVYQDENATVAHVELTLGNGMVMLGSVKETAHGKLLVRRRNVGDVTMSVYVIVADPDAHYARARAAGAVIAREPVTQEYGGRDYTAKDPEGNVWTFGTYDPWAVR
jgi:uncharacterized glyoxalase superfamily protein PhnB